MADIAQRLAERRQSILLIEPGLEGGVGKHVRDLIALMQSRANFFRLAPNRGGMMRFTSLSQTDRPPLYFRMPFELDGLLAALRANSIQRVHYHNTLRLDADILRLPETLGVPYDYTVHDYSSFCPQIYLTTEKFRYCGEPDEAGCNACLRIRPAPAKQSIEQWRARHRGFIEAADRIFIPSASVDPRIRKHFANASLVAAPHPEPQSPSPPSPPVWRHREGPLKIVVVGALSAIKGADTLEACAIDAAARNLPLEFHLIGYPYRNLAPIRDRLIVHGKYDDAKLPELIRTLAPDLAWFPGRWPETYCYTLSAVLRDGLPVTTTNLGAIQDRLAGRDLSWSMPWMTNAAGWNDFFMTLKADPASGASQLIAPLSPAAKPFSYVSDYVQGEPVGAPTDASERDFSAYSRPLRPSARVLAQYLSGYARLGLSAAYRLPGIRVIAVTLFPEFRLQLLRRWLDKY